MGVARLSAFHRGVSVFRPRRKDEFRLWPNDSSKQVHKIARHDCLIRDFSFPQSALQAHIESRSLCDMLFSGEAGGIHGYRSSLLLVFARSNSPPVHSQLNISADYTPLHSSSFRQATHRVTMLPRWRWFWWNVLPVFLFNSINFFNLNEWFRWKYFLYLQEFYK